MTDSITEMTIKEFDAIPDSSKLQWNVDAILKDFEIVKRIITKTSLIGVSYNHFAYKYASKKLKHIDKDEVCAIIEHLLNLDSDDIIKQKLCVYVRIRI